MNDAVILAVFRIAFWLGIGIVAFLVVRELFIAAINWVFDIQEDRWWH
jgi:hypothetical protein